LRPRENHFRFPTHLPGEKQGHLAGLSLLSLSNLCGKSGSRGLSHSPVPDEFDRHIAHVSADDAALPWDRLGHWAQDEGDWALCAHVKTIFTRSPTSRIIRNSPSVSQLSNQNDSKRA